MGSAQSTSCEKLWDSCAPKNGDRDNVDLSLKGLRNKTITVLEIGHYRERSNKGPILHDFVGFHVRLGDEDKFRIKAEKLASPAGIVVTHKVCWDEGVEMKYECKNLEDCGKIRMEDLLAILKEPSPDYHLLSDNCWSYADTTFKQVIRKFSETPSLSPERRSYLASFLNKTSPAMPDEVLRSVGFAAAKAAVLEIPLWTIIIIGGVGAAAVAAVVAPTTLPAQVADFYIALRCAGLPITSADAQNFLHMTTAPFVPQLLRACQAYQGGVHTNSATQAVPVPLITRAFRSLVSLAAFIFKWAVWVAPYLAAGVGIVFIVYALVKLFIFGRHATSLEHSFQRRWRSLFPRRPLNQAQGLPPL